MELKDVELFRVGRWNDVKNFTVADIDAMAESFRELRLGGRTPLKFGHNDSQPLTDGQPALGWLARVWRDGDVLKGDFADVPKVVHDAIKNGNYKFVSVELLRDVVAGNREYPWVLSAVALLGADVPAVHGLRDLQSLAMTRRATFQTGTRMTFTTGGRNKMDEVTKLKLALVDQAIDFAISSGRVTPAERERFTRRYGEQRTLADWTEWVKDAPRPPAHMSRQQRPGRSQDADDERPDSDPGAEVVRRAQEKIEKSNGQLAYFTAQQQVLREDPELAEAYRFQPGIMD